MEFPRLNDRLDGNAYTYLYMVKHDELAGGLVKINLDSRELRTWHEQGFEAGEPVFIPAPEAKEEDEGITLALIFNKATQDSFLLVLDGQTFQERGRASLPFHIRNSFHGQFFSEILYISHP